MKTEQEIREQLRQTYEYRLSLRISRKEKNSCKNCEKGIVQNLDLGELGEYVKYNCINGFENKCNNCPVYKCKYTREQIEEEMINDIKDPSVCGCKEPKIAALLWVLHNNKKEVIEESKEGNKETSNIKRSILEFFFGSKDK